MFPFAGRIRGAAYEFEGQRYQLEPVEFLTPEKIFEICGRHDVHFVPPSGNP